ncbi:MAG: tRNA (adenosine(37)-N6)-threonylcarbamoyltransferase complex dimerization subunit type 1 TsaB [Thermoleophilia bacterium]
MSLEGPAGTPLVLAFDTSAAACSVALLALDASGDARPVSRRSLASAGAQTRLLLPLFEEVLAEAGATPGDLRALVVGTGPGTFTGVRIGVASARAAALALGVPVLGVSSLAALAAAALEECVAADAESDGPRNLVVPVVDARRGQVFGCVYGRAAAEARGAGEVWRRLGSIFAAAPDGVEAAVRLRAPTLENGRTVFVGRTDLLPPELPPADGARTLLRDVDASFLLRGHHRLEGPKDEGPEGRTLVSWLTGAIGDGGWSGDVARPGDPGTPEAVRPIYVRAPDADLHITKMKDPWEA